MVAKGNREIIRRYYEAFGSSDPGTIEELTAPDWVCHDPSMPRIFGRSGASQLYTLLKAALPDLSMTIVNMGIDRDQVAACVWVTGTSAGPLLGGRGPGTRVAVTQVAVHRVRGGLISGTWVVSGALGLVQLLEDMPPLCPEKLSAESDRRYTGAGGSTPLPRVYLSTSISAN